ncbi:MAG TPA: glycosyltransferase family 1 protein, partial [Ramlibacter sp.]|nr:glycosyltransferase family 1 protein [Ramlibacter sp.]
YDLLPLLLPQHFDAGGPVRHDAWLRVAADFDGAVCISRAVADELHDWLQRTQPARARRVPLQLGWFHLGADITNAMPSKGMPPDAPDVLGRLRQDSSFLMVGTVEPRKGHTQVLDAFELLWASGTPVNLVIAGREGWMVAPLVQRLRTHPERGRRLFWLEGISDEYLQALYAACTCLIAASEGEGFGLPLIEAAQHGMPMIARDLPVFREVAREHAHYFAGSEPQAVAQAVNAWIDLRRAGREPRPEGLSWQTWSQSAQQLKRVLFEGEWYRPWSPRR